MPLNVPDGETCFIDGNIFYYHYVETSTILESCTLFLERVACGLVNGYTSEHVLAEAIHKIMLSEAATRFELSRAGLAHWLAGHPDKISGLQLFREAAAEIAAMEIPLLPNGGTELLREATACSHELGLMTNDALIVAMMRRHGLTHLATNDDDFDRVPGLTVWKPR